jgi:hypothetical protein
MGKIFGRKPLLATCKNLGLVISTDQKMKEKAVILIDIPCN